MHSPHDLYVPEGPAGCQVAHMLWTLGYRTVAMVTQVVLPSDEPEYSKHSKPNIPLPEPHIEWIHGLSPGLALPRPETPPRVLSRLHVVAEGLNHLHCLGTPAARAYDLISVEPRSEKVWTSLSQSSHLSGMYDILSWDTSQRLPFHLKRSALRVLDSRGVKLEIRYAGGLTGAVGLRNFLASSLELTSLSSNMKQLILSSGAQSPLECRGAADVANLARLFGVPSHQCHQLTNQNAASLVRKAAVRTGSYKGVISGTSEQLIKERGVPADEKAALLRLEMHESLAMATEECGDTASLRESKKRLSGAAEAPSKRAKPDIRERPK